MADPITYFRGEHFYLSNFYPIVMEFEGLSYLCLESAYQANKIDDIKFPGVKIGYSILKGFESKSYAHKCKGYIRDGFFKERRQVMERLLRIKFETPELKQKLMDTGKCEIIESGTSKDKYWGMVDGVGSNHLGKLLMMLRKEYQNSHIYDNLTIKA